MNIEQELKQVREKLERTKATRERQLGEWRQKIVDAKSRGVRGQHLADLQAQRDLLDSMSQQAISDYENEAKQLQEALNSEITARRTAARDAMKTLKQQHLDTWLLNGGTQASFDAAWPEMEKNILLERTTEQLKEKTAEVKKSYAGYF
jgi:hypothetical protein